MRIGFGAVVSFVAALVVSAGCASPPPPHYHGDYELEVPDGAQAPDGDEAVRITGIEQAYADVTFPFRFEVPVDLSVELEVDAAAGEQDWQLERDDLQLVADVPERHRMIAGEPGERRSPDELHVRRDGDWVETGSVQVDADRDLELRAHFEQILPYVERDNDDETGHFQPVDIRLEVPTGGDSKAGAVLTDADGEAPVWSRQSMDRRALMGVHATAALLDQYHVSPGFGFTMGGHFQLSDDVYLRTVGDLNFGTMLRGTHDGNEQLEAVDYYEETGIALTVGYGFDLLRGKLGLGAGWAVSGLMTRETRGWNLPHRAVFELTSVRVPRRSYPYRTDDFYGDYGAYLRFMPRLGNFGTPDVEAPGFKVIFGIAFHPAGG